MTTQDRPVVLNPSIGPHSLVQLVLLQPGEQGIEVVLGDYQSDGVMRLPCTIRIRSETPEMAVARILGTVLGGVKAASLAWVGVVDNMRASRGTTTHYVYKGNPLGGISSEWFPVVDLPGTTCRTDMLVVLEVLRLRMGAGTPFVVQYQPSTLLREHGITDVRPYYQQLIRAEHSRQSVPA